MLRLLPERALESLQARDPFDIVEERESFDYVYSLESLVGLEGSALSKLRRDVTRFGRLHPDHRFFDLDFSDPALPVRLRSATALWQCQKDPEGTVGHYCRALQALSPNPPRSI